MWKPGNPEENHIEKEVERKDLILMNHHTLPKILRQPDHCPILLLLLLLRSLDGAKLSPMETRTTWPGGHQAPI